MQSCGLTQIWPKRALKLLKRGGFIEIYLTKQHNYTIFQVLSRTVYVYRDYRLEVEFRVSFDDFRRLCVGCEPNGGRITTVESAWFWKMQKSSESSAKIRKFRTFWWTWRDSNSRPLGCEPNALPAELQALIDFFGGIDANHLPDACATSPNLGA